MKQSQVGKNIRTPELQFRIDKTRADAHREVVRSGKIQFRLDSKHMEQLLQVADAKLTGAGVLARMWVIERLNSEPPLAQAPSSLHKRISQLEQRIHSLEKSRKHA